MKKPQQPVVEQGHHFFGSTPFNWATGKTRQEVIEKLAAEAGSEMIKRSLRASNTYKGIYCWTCRVGLPPSAEYRIANFQPQGVPVTLGQEHNIVSVKGYVTLIEKEESDEANINIPASGSNQPNIPRLELLVTMLDEVSARKWKPTSPFYVRGLADQPVSLVGHFRRFNLMTWLDYTGDINDKNCGYSACAVGHAALDKRFSDQGLIMLGDCPLYKEPETEDYPLGRSWINWAAVERFFGLNERQAEFLFQNRNYPDAKYVGARMVANRVREFIISAQTPYLPEPPKV